MDLWVVAAAAGAGYIAKNLQNLSVEKKENSGESSKFPVNIQSESKNFLQQLRDKTCPLRRLAGKRAKDDSFFESDGNFPEFEILDNRKREAGVASTSDDALKKNGVAEENLEFEDGESRNFSRGKKGKIIRSRRCGLHSVRALSSVGTSCVDSQLIREHEEMEEGSLLLSIPTLKTVLVTDGSRIISRSGSDSSFLQFEGCRDEGKKENGVNLKVCNRVLSSSQFESVEDFQTTAESCSGNLQLSSFSRGSNGMLQFIIGMTVGILCATMSSKNEVDELNNQLKQTQNLVQDLHEELDMKEMLTVEELTKEGGNKNDTPSVHEPIASPTDVRVKTVVKFDNFDENDKNVEVMSKIEAELEAELEMLEQNLKVSALERISDIVELDPDFEPIVVQGDLNSMFSNENYENPSDSGNESTDTNTHFSQPSNFMVSPWELTICLHELIESRLEAQVKELETALAESQNRISRFSYNQSESSSTSQSPSCICELDQRENGILSNYLDEYSFEGPFGREKQFDLENDSISMNLFGDMAPEVRDKEVLSIFMSNEDCRSEEEEDDGSDESEVLLIKQILERRKSGSTAVLKL